MIEDTLTRIAEALELIGARLPSPAVAELATLQKEATCGNQSMPMSTSRAIDNAVIQGGTTQIFDTFKDAPAVLNVEGELGDPANEKQYRDNLIKVLTDRGIAIPSRTRTTTLFKMYQESQPQAVSPQFETASPPPLETAFPPEIAFPPETAPPPQPETAFLPPVATVKEVLAKLQTLMVNKLVTHPEILKMLQDVGGVAMLKNLREDQAPVVFAAASLFDSTGAWPGMTPEFKATWGL